MYSAPLFIDSPICEITYSPVRSPTPPPSGKPATTPPSAGSAASQLALHSHRPPAHRQGRCLSLAVRLADALRQFLRFLPLLMAYMAHHLHHCDQICNRCSSMCSSNRIGTAPCIRARGPVSQFATDSQCSFPLVRLPIKLPQAQIGVRR